MNDRIDTSGSWERAGLPPRLLRRATAVALVLAVVSTASVFVVRGWGSGVGASRAPTPPSAPEPPSANEDPFDPGVDLYERPASATPKHVWAAVPRTHARAAVVYDIAPASRLLAVAGRGRAAKPCHAGSGALEVGDFVGDRVIFSDVEGLYSIHAGCRREPRLLVRSDAVGGEADDVRIACPSVSPSGEHIVFSVYGDRGDRLWRIDRGGGNLVPLGETPGCGWIDEHHVMALDHAVVDPWAVPAVTDGERLLLRDPHRWRGGVSPDARAFVVPGDRERRFVVTGSDRTRLRTRVSASCAGGGVEPYTGTIEWLPRASRLSMWHPSEPWFLHVDGLDRVRVMRSDATEVDRVPLGACDGHLPIRWFGSHAIIRAIGPALRVFDFSTRATRLVKLPGIGTDRSPQALVAQRRLSVPRPVDPFLPASELRRVALADLGVSMLLPPGWDAETCLQWCRRNAYRVASIVQGPVPHRGGHTTGVPMSLGRSPLEPVDFRAWLTQDWTDDPDCGPDTCGRINEEGTVEVGGRPFEMIDVTFWEGRAVYLFAGVGDGTLIIELPARLHVNDLTVQTALDSMRFAA